MQLIGLKADSELGGLLAFLNFRILWARSQEALLSESVYKKH